MTDKITKLVLDAGGSIIESDTGTWDGMEMFKGNVVFESIDDVEKMLNAAPTPPNTVALTEKCDYCQCVISSLYSGVCNRGTKCCKIKHDTITIPVDEYERLKKDAERLEHVDDLLYQIESWCKAYPLTIFTEPDWDEVNEKLGSTLLTRVSGSNMRHVVTGIQAIIDKARSTT